MQTLDERIGGFDLMSNASARILLFGDHMGIDVVVIMLATMSVRIYKQYLNLYHVP